MPRKSKEDAEGLIFENKDYYLYAADLINRYLGDRQYFIGGPIPKSKLLSAKSIQTVLRVPFDLAVDYAHEHCIPRLKPPADHDDSATMPWEVEYMVKTLRELHAIDAPKRFRGGLMLLYFKFCKGHAIPDPPEIPEIVECEDSIKEECYETWS